MDQNDANEILNTLRSSLERNLNSGLTEELATGIFAVMHTAVQGYVVKEETE
jgi:hypothetical protein